MPKTEGVPGPLFTGVYRSDEPTRKHHIDNFVACQSRFGIVGSSWAARTILLQRLTLICSASGLSEIQEANKLAVGSV
jgi:hypothetical protein